MKPTSIAALASLAGLIACVAVYPYHPLPAAADTVAWTASGLWLPLLVLGAGLVCFVVLLITGLITVLNWVGDRARGRGGER